MTDGPTTAPARQLTPTRATTRSFPGREGRAMAALVATPDGPVAGVVVLVPGYTGSKEDFAPLLDPLAAAGLETVALDLPGQFESDGPDDPAGYAPAALATDLVLVAGALRSERPESPVHLLGHSYGGLVARAAVIAAPAVFDSLVLLGSGPSAVGGRRRALIEAVEPLLATQGVEAVYEATLALSRTLPDWEEPPAALGAFLRRRFVTTSAAHLEGVGRAIRDEPDRVDELAALAPRALVACGVADDVWPPAVQEEMARRLGATFVAVPEAVHSPGVENPAALVEVLRRFWGR